MDYTISMQQKRLTFCARVKMTFMPFSLNWRAQAVWITALWRSGATVSFHLTDQHYASVVIVNGRNPRILTALTASKRTGMVRLTQVQTSR